MSTVVYGGPTAPYAFVVHERLDVHHEPPTQARYLADAVPRVKSVISRILRRKFSAAVGAVIPDEFDVEE